MPRSAPTDGEQRLRWRVVGNDAAGAQQTLFEHEDGWQQGRGELAGLELLHVRAKRVINRVHEASQQPFRWTVNPYRGCSHACVYCFARPTHEYLGLGIGDDFDRRIVAKINAPERARAELAAPSWRGESVALGTNTDPYQPCEKKLALTRGVLDALADAGNPFSVLTKSPLILRDLDVLARGAARAEVMTALSVGTLDRAVWRATEPRAPDPRRRLDAVARLNDAGVPCGVLIAPVLPGLSDSEESLQQVIRGAVEAGATSVDAVMLHLRPGVRQHYLGWLWRRHPHLAGAYQRRYRDRSYGPADERRRLARLVEAIVREEGGRSPSRSRQGRFGTRTRNVSAPLREAV
ncbi:MAG: radical SAM protein [Miltoncostaeaceae bacterium]